MKKGNFLSYVLFAFAIIAAAILQTTIFNYLRIFSVKPDLLLLSVATASLIFNFRAAFMSAIFCAILKDALMVNAFGMNIILFPSYVFLLKRISKSISLDNNFIRIFLVFGLAVIDALLTRLFLWHKFIPIGISLKVIFIGSLYTTFIAFLLFRSLKFIGDEN